MHSIQNVFPCVSPSPMGRSCYNANNGANGNHNYSNNNNDHCNHCDELMTTIANLNSQIDELQKDRDEWKARCLRNNNNNNRNSDSNNNNDKYDITCPNVVEKVMETALNIFDNEIEVLNRKVFDRYGTYKQYQDVNEGGTQEIVAMDAAHAPNLFSTILQLLYSRDVKRLVDNCVPIQDKLR